MDLNGKVAIVTGGVQGIGKAISKSLLAHGMKVVICDINDNAGKLFIEEVSDKLKPNVIYQRCDVSSYTEFKAAFEKAKSAFGRIDLVINNAGLLNEREWKRMIEINFIGVINGIHLAFEYMGINNGGLGGYVINTSSKTGLRPGELAPIYAGTKHGIIGLTRSYGGQYHYERTKVKVNAICPGFIDSPMFYAYPGGSVDEKCALEYTSKETVTSPDEVAKGVIKILQEGKTAACLEVNEKGIYYAEL